MTPSPADNPFDEALKLHRAGRLDAAEAMYRKVLEAQPGHFNSLRLLGVIESQRGNHAAAVRLIEAALTRNPNAAEGFNSLGNALRKLKRLDEAVTSFDRAISLKPAYAKAYNNRGGAFHELKRLDEAVASYDQAIALDPDFADALKNRGDALQELRRLEEAVASYDHAVALRPDFAEALNNCGSALHELKRLHEALRTYDRAIALKPGFANAYVNRGMTRLLLGRLQDGWEDLEWRWKANGLPGRHPAVDAPIWQGEALGGLRIAIWAEQGLGDVIQSVRYLPLLMQRGAKVVFLAPETLVRVLRPLSSVVEVVDSMKGAAPFDFQCALMSVPLRFGTNLHSVPSTVPYLSAEKDLADRWTKHLGGHGFKIGIAWQGNPDRRLDRGRSIPLAEFVPLARVPGVRLISLQKKHGLGQLAGLPADANVEILPDGFDSGPDAFIDTAAVMAGLDLIITSDTSIAHLAGALGRPTWLALKHVPEWRWLIDREDCPWYPAMRLFRQETEGDWKSVFSKIEKALRDPRLD
jgi:tetratricopeptide (TPR) repeat protein